MRQELIDYDYVDQLSEADKTWLNKFTEEYINTNLDRNSLKNNLHNTKKLKKDCDDRSNARRRCILTRTKATGEILYLEDLKTVHLDPELTDETHDLENTSDSGDNNGNSAEDL